MLKIQKIIIFEFYTLNLSFDATQDGELVEPFGACNFGFKI